MAKSANISSEAQVGDAEAEANGAPSTRSRERAELLHRLIEHQQNEKSAKVRLRNPPSSDFDRERFRHSLVQVLDTLRAESDSSIALALVGDTSADNAASLKKTLLKKWRTIAPHTLTRDALRGRHGPVNDDDIAFIKSSFEKARAEWDNAYRFLHFFADRLLEKDHSLSPPSLAQRLERLAEFARSHNDEAVQKYAAVLIPEWSIGEPAKPVSLSADSMPLPTEAPETYQGLRGPETPPAFVERVYGPWLGHGLTRAHIRNLDPKLSTAINNWVSRPGNEWPADVDLPTLKEQNSRWAERVQTEGLGPVLGSAEPGFALKEAARLRGVLERRKEK